MGKEKETSRCIWIDISGARPTKVRMQKWKESEAYLALCALLCPSVSPGFICCFWKFFNLTVDTNTVGLMSIFILACQKDTVCKFWNRNRDGLVNGPASWVRNVRASLTTVTLCHLGFYYQRDWDCVVYWPLLSQGKRPFLTETCCTPCVGKQDAAVLRSV